MRIRVIGGGVMGLTCAWRLARRGAQVDLFEARNLGEGASLNALGALWPASPLARRPIQELQRQSLWQFAEFTAELAEFTGAPVPFQRNGRLELLNSPKAFARAQQEAELARAEWPPFSTPAPVMEALAPSQVPELYPTLAAPHHGALLCRATAQVHVPSLLGALRIACERSSVRIQEQTPLLSLEAPSHDVTLITTGAWTSRLLPETLVAPAKGQGIALARPSDFRLPHILKSGTTYLVPWQEEILVGSTTEPEAGFDETPTDHARELLHQHAAAIFPQLAHARILRHWAGLRPDAPDHRPVMGPLPQQPNVYLCAGHYKTGVALAPLVSTFMSQLILDRQTPPELLPFLPAAA